MVTSESYLYSCAMKLIRWWWMAEDYS